MINCWLQLPGRSFDTWSQSICTATHPYCESLAPVYLYNSQTLTPSNTCTKYPSYPVPISHLTLCSFFTSTALHHLHSSITSVLSLPQPTSLCPHLQHGHISCSCIFALHSALSPCFLFKPFCATQSFRIKKALLF